MSEEEKIIINLIKINNKHGICTKDNIDFLLKIVEKERKEIEELKSIASEFTNRNIEQFSIGEFNFKVKHFKDNYIHKDRIREAIRDRELEIYADNEEICNADGFYNIAFLYDKTIDVLKELLEEE